MKGKNTKQICIACSIVEAEVRQLITEKKVNIPFIFLDSMLHMNSKRLKEKLDIEINKALEQEKEIILLYGDCHNHMDKYDENNRIKRVKGVNCIELLIGETEYHILLRDGAFFMLYEWTKRWKHIFENELGLTGKNAQSLMNQMHKYLLYINTGLVPIPHDLLKEASDYVDLPYKTIDIDCTNLLSSILECIEKE